MRGGGVGIVVGVFHRQCRLRDDDVAGVEVFGWLFCGVLRLYLKLIFVLGVDRTAGKVGRYDQ